MGLMLADHESGNDLAAEVSQKFIGRNNMRMLVEPALHPITKNSSAGCGFADGTKSAFYRN
jgi:hypothetical protein